MTEEEIIELINNEAIELHDCWSALDSQFRKL